MSGLWQTGLDGAVLTMRAFDAMMPGNIGGIICLCAVMLFGFTCLISYYAYAERAAEYIWGSGIKIVVKILWIVMILVGSQTTLGFAWDLADTFNGLMIIPNLLAILLLSNEVVKLKQEYFEKKRKEFNIFFIPMGTPFQLQVWSKMAQIPYGKIVTYGQLAAAIGQPTAARAVANAVGENPFLIFLPCHRVVAADGLGGFSAGLEAKRALLRLEGVEISENTAFSEKFLFTFE